MRYSAKKRICISSALIVLLIIVSVGCGNATNQSTVTLTLTEVQVQRHVPQQPIITTQEVRNGDTVTLAGFDYTEWRITIIEIQDNSVIVLIEPDEPENHDPYETEIAFGEEYEIWTNTLSSWVDWTLLFSKG